jgi:hypothetical protein
VTPIVAAAVAFVFALPAGWGWGAEGHSSSVESAELRVSGGFVRFEASFKDSGEGSSELRVWIEAYEGSGSGASHKALARKSGKGACQAGRTCVTLLRTVVQVLPGECYVGNALSTSEEGTSEKQSPASGRLCP